MCFSEFLAAELYATIITEELQSSLNDTAIKSLSAAAEVKLKGGEIMWNRRKQVREERCFLLKDHIRRRAMHDEDLIKMKSSDFITDPLS